jgi:alcohol dehydrogenase class IV
MTDALCVQAIPHAARALPVLWDNPADHAARAAMSFASLLGGMALANAGLGAVHGFAAPIGGMFPAPHGAVCAALLPYAFEVNLRASKDTARFDEIARLVTADPGATAAAGVRWIADLCRKLEIPPLRSYGMTADDLPAVVEKASQASSMKANPVQLSHDQLHEIVSRAL